MITNRLIPCLLVKDGGLWKTVRFSKPVYVGDPINAVRVFNDKEVDELVVLDTEAGRDGRQIDYALLEDLAAECFMPLCYGGGIRSLEDMRRVFAIGVEKVSVNTAAIQHPALLTEAAAEFGTQSIVVSMDVRRDRRGRPLVHIQGGRNNTRIDAVRHARDVEGHGAGEILLTSIDREGTGQGLDLALIHAVSDAVSIPVVGHGGAGSLPDLVAGLEAGATAVAAGSLFVFHGKHRAVLINYPSQEEWKDAMTRLGSNPLIAHP